MKKYFKNGIALILPIALVVWVVLWIYNKGSLVVDAVAPASWGSAWWYPILGIIAIVVAVFLIGLIFSWMRPLKWAYKKFEDWIIGRIPIINKLYGFGKEVADSFVTDIKEDGYLAVVAVTMLGGESIGVLTDPENNTCFIPTAPNPSNGFLVRTTKYRVIDTMEYMEAIKFVTSIGKINGHKWTKKTGGSSDGKTNKN
jgi:uncharacterized membrane protein